MLAKISIPFKLCFRHYNNGGIRGLGGLFIALLMYALKSQYCNIGTQNRYCPCCKWKGRQFAPYISWSYVVFHSLCPSCYSHARHRGHKVFYDQYKFNSTIGKLLYFAPEYGIIKYLQNNPNLQIYTSNYGESRNKMLDENISNYNFNLMDIECKDNMWDIIICHRVLEHIPDDQMGLQELFRILKPSGILILSVPINVNLDETIIYDEPNPYQNDHYYNYGKDFMSRIPEEFNVTEVKFSDLCPSKDFIEMSLLEDYIYVCSKPELA